MIQVNLEGIEGFADLSALDYSLPAAAHRSLTERSGEGSEFTGWLRLPEEMRSGGLKPVLTAANRIRNQSAALVVIGIGGSYLGARAGLELIRSQNYNLLKKDTPDVFFAGNTLSPCALGEIAELLGDRDFSINVISKSGSTLEPALSFRVFKSLLEKKYGAAGARKRIFATTGSSGVLYNVSEAEGYERLTLPEDVGGRYSVLSPVGLLPMACAGIDVEKIVSAASEAMQQLGKASPANPAWQYACARNHLYTCGKTIELLACYEPSFRAMAEWWKQLFGESEGKNGVGIFPASLEYSADLHSMGQYVQDGPRCLMETVVRFKDPGRDLRIPFEIGDKDGLNYLAGKPFDYVNKTAEHAVKSAHVSGGVPNIGVVADTKDETGFAELVCFFEVACAISGYMLGVNPFDQPGVEAYKKNMFKLLSAAADPVGSAQ